MNDPNNPGRVYNTDERLAGAAEREPPPKPVRKPDPSLRQLQRQISIGQVGKQRQINPHFGRKLFWPILGLPMRFEF